MHSQSFKIWWEEFNLFPGSGRPSPRDIRDNRSGNRSSNNTPGKTPGSQDVRRGQGQNFQSGNSHQRAFAFSQTPSQQHSSQQSSDPAAPSRPASISEAGPLPGSKVFGPHDIFISNLKFGFQVMELGDFLFEKHQITVSFIARVCVCFFVEFTIFCSTGERVYRRKGQLLCFFRRKSWSRIAKTAQSWWRGIKY